MKMCASGLIECCAFSCIKFTKFHFPCVGSTALLVLLYLVECIDGFIVFG